MSCSGSSIVDRKQSAFDEGVLTMLCLSDILDLCYVNMDLFWYVSFYSHSTILEALLWLSHSLLKCQFGQKPHIKPHILTIENVDVMVDTKTNTSIGTTAF